MQMYAIKREEVNRAWQMRTHRWLDLYTGKPKFSVQVRHPEMKKWAHVYDPATSELVFFESEEAAQPFIRELKGEPDVSASSQPVPAMTVRSGRRPALAA